MFKIRLTSIIILLLLAQFFSYLLFAEETPDTQIIWQSNFEEVQQQAKKDGKLILLYFSGSDWCRPCMQLKSDVFETEAFKEFANENFILTLFDFPAQKTHQLPKEQKSHNEKMAEKYNSRGAFPIVVIVDYQGKKFGE